MKIKTAVIQGIKYFYLKIIKPKQPRFGNGWCSDKERNETNELLYELLTAEESCYIGRVGTSEGGVLMNYIGVYSSKPFMRKCYNYIRNEINGLPWWDEPRLSLILGNNAGFFPIDDVSKLEQFAKLYLEDIPAMDVCGRFEYYEQFLPFNPNCKIVQLETLYPFFVEHPWSKALAGKRVLVVHPFAETIENQYKKRKLLFSNQDVLPDFELKTIKAIQTVAGQKSQFKDWFEALDSMKEQIMNTEFDVCIIGCGAYGLPLAAFVKKIGKKALHFGGGTQLLFGIKGKRWEYDYQNSCYRDMFNEHWVYLSENERPENAEKVEGACYW